MGKTYGPHCMLYDPSDPTSVLKIGSKEFHARKKGGHVNTSVVFFLLQILQFRSSAI